MAATAEQVKDYPGEEAADVVRMDTLLRNLFTKRRREGNRWGGIVLIFFFCFLMRKTK